MARIARIALPIMEYRFLPKP
ncbi:uncharacterized protein G2W53_019338 [Senna tora]|uniref:Uncharacterized protein n=1 Tax=Senna tora TaxID=362788 RepID=A0A834TUQ0_9FABA|nr:uncharacterized protein G2W53_019338 [Senna tora]